MKKILLAACSLFMLSIMNKTFAEGTKQLEPGTNGVTKLQAGSDRGFNIATYTSPAEKRYYIHIEDPSEEIVYFGFGRTFDGSGSKPTYFRIKDPNGNIVVAETLVPTAGQGYIATKDQAVLGPSNLGGGAGGYNPLSFKPTLKGDYYIEFKFNDIDGSNRVTFENIDITVANTTTNSAINGRFWAYQWNLYSMMNGVSMPTFAKFFAYTTDSIVTQLDLNGMEPMSFIIQSNSRGTTRGNIFEDSRMSIEGNYSYPEYKVFLNDPDPLVYPSYTSVLKIENLGLNLCNASCEGISLSVNKKTTGEIFLDIDNDGRFTPNSRDKLFYANLESGANCIPWNGLDGQGNKVNYGETVKLGIKTQSNAINFPIFDPESNTKGIKVKLVRPINESSQNPLKLYWDDSKIGGTQSSPEGCISDADNPETPGCHIWPDPFGDNRTINTWAFAYKNEEIKTVVYREVVTNCSVTDLERNATKTSSFAVSPNPFSEGFKINNPSLENEVLIEISDLSGKVLSQEAVNNLSAYAGGESLPSKGVYVVMVKSLRGEILNTQLVVKE